MSNHTQTRIVQRFFASTAKPEFLPSGRLAAPTYADTKHMVNEVAQRLTPDYAPPICHTRSTSCAMRAGAAWFAVPQEHMQKVSLKTMPRREAAVISNHDGYSGY
ncbi:hypothetical protein TNCV_433551 [Trichonephila clavipes]|nr:hypothetical protein TNCV_433551 [Trichonephila clavipes]